MSYERDLLHAAEHPPEGETCPECHGDGTQWLATGKSEPCPICNGLGYLVPDGDALADEAGDRMYDERTGA